MRKVVLFLLLLSITGFSISGEDCDLELTYPVVLEEDFNCPELDLIITGEFDSGDYSLSVNTLTITSGKIIATNLDSLIVDGTAEYSSASGLTITDLEMKSGSFLPDGTSLSVTNLYYISGDLDLGNDKTILLASLESPITGEIIKQVENNYGNFNLFSEEGRLLSYSDDEWTILDTELIDSYFSVTEEKTFVIVSDQDLQDSLVGPVITLSDYTQFNKTDIELSYSVESYAAIQDCDLYLGVDLQSVEEVDNKFSLEDLLDATYSWKVSCLDIWGNSSESDSKEFTVINDTETPSIIFEIDPNKYDIGLSEEIEIFCEATDNVDISQIRIFDIDRTICTGHDEEGCSRKQSWGSEGERELFCTALDSNGNNETSSLTVNVVEEGVNNNPNTVSNNNDNSNDNSNFDEDNDDAESEKQEVTGLAIADDVASLTFPIEDLSINEIIVFFDNETSGVDVEEVEPEDNEAPGTIYQYLEITSDAEIEEAKIKFTVPKSWLEENEINKEDIVLLHYKDDWKELSTRIIKEEQEYLEFEATCYSFSLFAVGAKAGIDFSLAIGIVVVGALIVAGFVMSTRTRSRTPGYSYRPHRKKF